MIRFSISDWPFSLKFLAPATVAIIATLGMGAYAVQALNDQALLTANVVDQSNKTMKEIVSVDFSGTALLSHISSDVQALNGRFYELLTRESAKLNNNEGAGEILKLKGDAKNIVSNLEDYNEKFASDDQKTEINSLVTQINENFIVST